MPFIEINKDNYAEVAKIYQEGLDTGVATFETEVPSWEKWNLSHHTYGRVALKELETIQGWGALSPVSSRFVYRGVAEVSLYVSANQRGRGLGKIILSELIRLSQDNGIWTLQSGIFKENKASRKLHLDCGFREIGYRERVAQRNGVWYDNVLMERRSGTIEV